MAHGGRVVTRIRVGFAATTLLGAVYATANINNDTHLLTGVVVVMLGLIGTGAIDWIER